MPSILDVTSLSRINLRSVEGWDPSQLSIDMNAQTTGTLDILLRHQTDAMKPRIKDLLRDPNKNFEVRIFWNDFCNKVAEDCDDSPANDNSCGDLEGPPIEKDFQDYELTSCIRHRFSVDEETYTQSTEDPTDDLAEMQRNALKVLLERLNLKAMIFLKMNAGPNMGETFQDTGGDYRYIIPSDVFTDADTTVYADLIRDSIDSRLANPFLLDYGNFWRMNFNALIDGANGEGKGNAARARLFNIETDLFGPRQLPSIKDSTFAITPYSYAFVNKSYFQRKVTLMPGVDQFRGSTPVYDAASNKWKWYITIPGYNIVVDVLMQRVCVNQDKNLFQYIFQYTLHYDWFLNPAGCEINGEKVTGIIEYVKEGGVAESLASS